MPHVYKRPEGEPHIAVRPHLFFYPSIFTSIMAKAKAIPVFAPENIESITNKEWSEYRNDVDTYLAYNGRANGNQLSGSG